MADEYRNLSNEEYWAKRSEEQMSKHWRDLKNVEKELASQHRIAYEDIRQMVSDLYTKYATDNGLSYQEASRQLNQTELRDYRNRIDTMLPLIRQTNDPNLIAEFEKLQKSMRISRLQALMNQIDAKLLYMGYTQQMTMDEWLMKLYEQNYYQTLHAIHTGVGVGITFAVLNERAIKQAITYPWSGDMFSDRVWDNKDRLVRELRQTITQGLIKGESVQKMARNLNQKMDSGYKNSLRLIRTETGYVLGESTAQGYQESGLVSQYVIVATLDGRTSPICRKQDNKVYNLKDKQVGVNYPPFHPNCRTAVAPYFGAEDLENSLRIARGEDGKTYHVPASMNYQEWHSKYVKQRAS